MRGADFYISDLHLSPDTAAQVRLFECFLDVHAAEARSLVVNGDFFNAYAGFKQLRYPFYDELCCKLAALVERGVRVEFVAGNRDFLFRRDAARYGIGGHAEWTRNDGKGERVIITHGDAFCLEDKAYLRFRRWVRRVPWRAINRVTPPWFGQLVVGGFRKQSMAARRRNASRPTGYFDIKDEPVLEFLREREGDTMICGHIHQPQERCYERADGRKRRLLVLGDWHEEAIIAVAAPGERVELMRLSPDGLELWDHEILHCKA